MVTVARGARGQLSVNLTGAAGQATQIQQRVVTGWRTVATYTAPAASARVTVTGVTPGQTYRVVVPGSAKIAGVTSASIVA